MRITVLDGYTLNPGDLSWDDFYSLGEVKVYDRTSAEELFQRAEDSDAIIINKVVIGEKELEKLPGLKYIGITATGYNNVDLEAANKKGITVTNVPAYSTFSVAQHTFALLLEIMNKTSIHSDLVKNGRWSTSKDYCFFEGRLSELHGKTIGIIGMGNIGMQTAKIASAFGMDVIYYSRSEKESAKALGFIPVQLKELLAESDVISLHCPLTEKTRNLINEHTIALMKKDAVLINTSRGPLVDENALYHALKQGRLQAAGLDVLSIEPPQKQSPLMGMPNCIITPHIAWATLEARRRLMATACDNLKSFIIGNAKNQINKRT